MDKKDWLKRLLEGEPLKVKGFRQFNTSQFMVILTYSVFLVLLILSTYSLELKIVATIINYSFLILSGLIILHIDQKQRKGSISFYYRYLSPNFTKRISYLISFLTFIFFLFSFLFLTRVNSFFEYTLIIFFYSIILFFQIGVFNVFLLKILPKEVRKSDIERYLRIDFDFGQLLSLIIFFISYLIYLIAVGNLLNVKVSGYFMQDYINSIILLLTWNLFFPLLLLTFLFFISLIIESAFISDNLINSFKKSDYFLELSHYSHQCAEALEKNQINEFIEAYNKFITGLLMLSKYSYSFGEEKTPDFYIPKYGKYFSDVFINKLERAILLDSVKNQLSVDNNVDFVKLFKNFESDFKNKNFISATYTLKEFEKEYQKSKTNDILTVLGANSRFNKTKDMIDLILSDELNKRIKNGIIILFGAGIILGTILSFLAGKLTQEQLLDLLKQILRVFGIGQ